MTAVGEAPRFAEGGVLPTGCKIAVNLTDCAYHVHTPRDWERIGNVLKLINERETP